MWILCYPKCSTCRKAVNWLAERGIEATYRNIQAQNPSYEELRAWVERSGLPVRKFFNTSGLQYRALGLKDKLPQMGEEEQLRLLSTDGMLVKRPLLIGEDFVAVGFQPEQWSALLGRCGARPALEPRLNCPESPCR